MERMDFKSFCNAVVNGIAEYLLQYEIESIRLETVCHNNGVEHVGLVILLQGDYVSPTIYLEQYYQYMVRQQASLSDVLELVAKEYRLVEDCLQKQEPLTVDLDQMQSRVFLRLVNYERNQETLANCPYIPFHDMAITFRYLVKMDEAGIASALIDYDSMEKSACTVEELYCMAKENTIRLFPPFLMRRMSFCGHGFHRNMCIRRNRRSISYRTGSLSMVRRCCSTRMWSPRLQSRWEKVSTSCRRV